MEHRYGSQLLGTLVLIILFEACSSINIDNPEISIEELDQHIAFLASDSLKGRFPGTPEEIIQQTVKTQNVIAATQVENPFGENEFVVIGAHYDHLGFGETINVEVKRNDKIEVLLIQL